MDERKMILDMLKEGKITSEEAIRLLDALGAKSEPKKSGPSKQERLFTFDADKAKEGWDEFEKTVGGFVNNIVGTMSNMFDEDMILNFKGKYDSFTRRDEREVPEGETRELEVTNRNGRVEVLPTDEDKIVIESTIHHRNMDVAEDTRFYDIIEENGRIVYRVQENPDLLKKYYVELKLFIPKNALSSLSLDTTNARLSVEGLEVDKVHLTTKNGKIIAKQIKGDTLCMESGNARLELFDSEVTHVEMKTSNGRVVLEDIVADDITVNTSNGRVATRNLDAQTLSLKTTNGTVIGEHLISERLEDGHFSTSNGKVDIAFDAFEKEVELDLHTTMGSIDLQLPVALLYESNPSQKAKSVKAHTQNYTAGNGLSLFARTSNGNISLR